MEPPNVEQRVDKGFERVPPQDIPAERGVLGCCLVDPSAIDEALSGLKEADFYLASHRTIFAAFVDMHAQGQTPDTITVRSYLKQRGLLEQVGGVAYLMELVDPSRVPSTANLTLYVRLVAKEAERRRLIVAGTSLQKEAEQMLDPVEARSRHEERLNRLEFGTPAWKTTEVVLNSASTAESFKIGLTQLDDHTGGIMCGLNIFSGESNVGKTTLAIQVASRAAMAGHEVVIISYDQKLSGLAEMMWSAHTKTPIDTLRRSTGQYDTGRDEVLEWPISWYSGSFELPNIIASIRTKAGAGVRWFLIDYLGLIVVPGDERAPAKKLIAAESLKRLAHELELFIVLISRTTKIPQKERPALRHVEGEAGVGNAADQVWFLQPDRTNPEKVTVHILKSRQAAKGEVPLHFTGRVHRFSDWDE